MPKSRICSGLSNLLFGCGSLSPRPQSSLVSRRRRSRSVLATLGWRWLRTKAAGIGARITERVKHASCEAVPLIAWTSQRGCTRVSGRRSRGQEQNCHRNHQGCDRQPTPGATFRISLQSTIPQHCCYQFQADRKQKPDRGEGVAQWVWPRKQHYERNACEGPRQCCESPSNPGGHHASVSGHALARGRRDSRCPPTDRHQIVARGDLTSRGNSGVRGPSTATRWSSWRSVEHRLQGADRCRGSEQVMPNGRLPCVGKVGDADSP